MSDPAFSVVIPVYNSRPSLEELFHGIRNVFHESNDQFEVIFVDDASEDGSWEVIKTLKSQFPDEIRAAQLTKNCGQHAATFCGFTLAKGELVITIDDDLQVPPSEIKKLIGRFRETGSDMVYGFFSDKNHSVLRNLGSTSVKKTSKVFRGSPGEGSSFRLMKSGLIKNILTHQQHFIFIDEVLLWYTSDISFVDVEHWPRKYNQSNYTFRKLLKLFANILLFYTTIPLKVLTYGGLFTSVVFLIFGLSFIIKKIFFNVPIPGYTSLIVAILFSTGIILFSLGVIGEYLSRIYSVQNRKPLFTVRTIL